MKPVHSIASKSSRKSNIMFGAAVFTSALTLIGNQADAATWTWTGNSNSNYTTVGNWSSIDFPGTAPASANTTDLIFGAALGSVFSPSTTTTVRSITFNATSTGNDFFKPSNGDNTTSGGRTLAFSSDAGNATLTVVAGSNANIVFARPTLTVTIQESFISLTSSLDVVHNGSGTLTLGNGNGTGTPGGGTKITGAGGINKSGTGTLILGAPNTYVGGTTVSAGKLRLSNATGSATGTGSIALNGANVTTVSGDGRSTGAFTANSLARIAPGTNTSDADTSGRNNFGNAQTLSLGLTGGMTLAGATFDFDLANTNLSGNDLIATGGALSLGTAMAFNFNELDGGLATGVAYTLISGATSINTFDSSAWTTNFYNGANYTANYAAQGNNLTVTFVPEPTSAVMLGLGMTLVALRRRRA